MRAGNRRNSVTLSGIVVWSSHHESSGKAHIASDPDGDSTHLAFLLRFPGRYEDPETGLHYNRHRCYDPHIGRYLFPDPLGQTGSENIYDYTSADPIHWADPFGLFRVGTKMRYYYPLVAAATESAGRRVGNSNYDAWAAATRARAGDVNNAYTAGQKPMVDVGCNDNTIAAAHADSSTALSLRSAANLEGSLFGPEPYFRDDPKAGIFHFRNPPGPSPSAVARANSALDFALAQEAAHHFRVANGLEAPIGSLDPIRAHNENVRSDGVLNRNLLHPIFDRRRVWPCSR